MVTLNAIREDLKNIRYYYARKELFESAKGIVGCSAIKEIIDRYNRIICEAPPKLYDVYVSLYINNNTQEALSIAWNYTPEYIQILNKKLLKFLQNKLSA